MNQCQIRKGYARQMEIERCKQNPRLYAQSQFSHIDNNGNVVCDESKYGEILSIY